ncbi:acylphosphatase [Natranaerobius thermophilus]|uniref:Acylphosphatase n=1 Tax=Natranaerobius thermophilus (strain ATCC BAA-1301 / DSM 18059 / JW/NM-WN-LF) TaxID=457570 RepID=B2A612_NATTJ|nr:acylphosphatase [Natranaerobius thermophilus]ACB85429.1 acylphosphatase [Natranaerobius thermophilus JW/NM-WN-LF]
MAKTAFKGYLSGLVQGVGMRYSVSQVAKEIGVSGGYVRNLRDGRVEVYIEGDEERVEELKRILESNEVGTGQIEEVEGEWLEPQENLTEFEIRK